MPGLPSGRATSSCQIVIQGLSYATRRERRVHGPTRSARSESGGWGIGVIVARLGRRGSGRGRQAYPRVVIDPSDAEGSRPASQPIHRVAALRDVRIRVSDGLELSANLWLPE